MIVLKTIVFSLKNKEGFNDSFKYGDRSTQQNKKTICLYENFVVYLRKLRRYGKVNSE